MAREKPYADKSFLYDRYVTKKMTAKQIADELTASGYPVTEMTIYNHLKKNNLIRNSRNLGQRSFGKKPGSKKGGTKRKGFY